MKRLTLSVLFVVVLPALPMVLSAQAAPPSCIDHFQIIRWYDGEKPILGLTEQEQLWYQKELRRKYPSVCYEPVPSSSAINVLLAVSIRTTKSSGKETTTEKHDVPFTATETIDVNSSRDSATAYGTIHGNAEVTTSRTAPYEWTATGYLLEVRVWDPSGHWITMAHFVRGKAIYNGENGMATLGNLIGRSLNRHPERAILENAFRFITARP